MVDGRTVPRLPESQAAAGGVCTDADQPAATAVAVTVTAVTASTTTTTAASAGVETGPGLSIAQAAQVSGVTAHTLRYYERAGLMLDRVTRASSSHRRYGAADLRWIGTLTALRHTGMPIRQIAEYAALVRAGDGNEARRLELLAGHRRRVAERLAEVSRHLEAIDAKIEIYANKSEPVIERTLT